MAWERTGLNLSERAFCLFSIEPQSFRIHLRKPQHASGSAAHCRIGWLDLSSRGRDYWRRTPSVHLSTFYRCLLQRTLSGHGLVLAYGSTPDRLKWLLRSPWDWWIYGTFFPSPRLWSCTLVQWIGIWLRGGLIFSTWESLIKNWTLKTSMPSFLNDLLYAYVLWMPSPSLAEETSLAIATPKRP